MHATSSRQVRYPYSEYLVLEELSDTKHEFFDGEIYAMSGGTPEHAAVMFEILHLIRNQLADGCQAYSSELRIRIPTGLSTYPDGTVICGELQRAADDRNAATNPLLLVEVTSDATEQYDRSDKLEHYQTIPALKEILIVSHRKRHITLYRGEDEQRWSSSTAGTGEWLKLESIGATVQVDDVYRNILRDAPQR